MILVTGATGYVGSAVVRRLLSEGREVAAMVRDAGAASATCRTRGLPKSGTTSFVSSGPASKRDERPAARTIAALSLNGGIKGDGAPLRMGGVFNQKAAGGH